MEGSGRGLIQGNIGIFLEGLRKTTKRLTRDKQFPGRDLTAGHPEYKARMLTTRPRHSVHLTLCLMGVNKETLQAET
jgi:hypothetical protein